MSKIQEKWREPIVEPFKISFKKITLEKIISYPPAGNDVFDVLATMDNEKINCIIKVERSKMANFKDEIKILEQLENTDILCSKVIEYGSFENHKYIVISKIDGDKLSEIYDEEKENFDNLLKKYGAYLHKIHSLKGIKCNEAFQRVINTYPTECLYGTDDEYSKSIIEYLKDNMIDIDYNTYIHGDFHYGNVLFENGEVSGILDFEYSGYGFKEQDIAWALILRPGQKFMDNINHINSFLDGYGDDYDKNKLKWCLINGYIHFYLMNINNCEYIKKLKVLIDYYINLK